MVFKRISKKLSSSLKISKSKSKRHSDRFDSKSLNDDSEEVISSTSKPVASNGSSSTNTTASSRRDLFKDMKYDRHNGSGRVRQNTSETCLLDDDGKDDEDDEEGFFIEDNEEKTQQQEENNETVNCRPKMPRRSSLKKITGDYSSEFSSSSRDLNPKTVEFACPSRNTLHRTLSIEDMSSEEKRNTWLQPSCIEKIQKKAVQTVQTVEKFGDYDDKFCTRGLERYLSKHAHRRDEHVDSIEEVMCEQEVQDQFGVYCDKSIAAAYKSSGATSESQILAEAAAKKDREDVKENLRLFLEKSDVHDEAEAKCLAREYLKKYLANDATCPYKQQ